MDIKEIRLANLIDLLGRSGLDVDFCKKIDMNPSYLPQLKAKTKSIGDKVARRIEERLGLERGYMDSVHEKNQLPEKMPGSDALATAFSIESLPAPLRDSLKRLVMQVCAYCESPQEQPPRPALEAFSTELTIAARDGDHPQIPAQAHTGT